MGERQKNNNGASLNIRDLYFCKMMIKLLFVGKTDSAALQTLIGEYERRLGFYVRLKMETIPDVKKVKHLTETQQQEKEGEAILKRLQPSDVVVLLDERGKGYSSVGFSAYLQKKMNAGVRQLVFVIGGPYGFSEAVYKRAGEKLSLSGMTFSHQMIRLFFMEQLYRGFTILNNEPYHHQ